MIDKEPDGRLKQDNNPVGGLKALAWSRTVTTGRETETVTLRTAANRLTAYETTRFPDGQESKRTTWPDGTESFTRVALDDSTVETSPDGTVTTTALTVCLLPLLHRHARRLRLWPLLKSKPDPAP